MLFVEILLQKKTLQTKNRKTLQEKADKKEAEYH